MKQCSWTGISCGVYGLHTLKGKPAQEFYNMLNSRASQVVYWGHHRTIEAAVNYGILDLPAHYVFSDAVRYGNGERLRKWITKNKLGIVVSSNTARNRNSGNTIQTWIWVVNKTAVNAWFLKKYNRLNNKKNNTNGTKRTQSSSIRS